MKTDRLTYTQANRRRQTSRQADGGGTQTMTEGNKRTSVLRDTFASHIRYFKGTGRGQAGSGERFFVSTVQGTSHTAAARVIKNY